MKNLRRIYMALAIILIMIGLLLVFNASGYLAVKTGSSSHRLFNDQLVKAIGGMFVLIIASSLIPYRYYKKYSKHALIFVLFLLVITLVAAPKVNGASRWIDLGVFRLQPSELAKLALIIHLSNMLVSKGERVKSISNGLLYMLIWVLFVATLVFLQPNVSLSIIIVATSFVLLYVGGASAKHLISLAAPTFFLGGIFAMIFQHSRSRIIMFYNILVKGEVPSQVLQANIALGSGGLWGVGLGYSRQSDGFVPYAYGDFIFSILGEEFGFVGTVFVLLLYLALFFVGILIAKRVADRFAQLLVFGISFSILFGAFINAAVVLGLMPPTGITLPFISYGGTSLIVGCFSVGIVVNIAMENAKNQRANNLGVVTID